MSDLALSWGHCPLVLGTQCCFWILVWGLRGWSLTREVAVRGRLRMHALDGACSFVKTLSESMPRLWGTQDWYLSVYSRCWLADLRIAHKTLPTCLIRSFHWFFVKHLRPRTPTVPVYPLPLRLTMLFWVCRIISLWWSKLNLSIRFFRFSYLFSQSASLTWQWSLLRVSWNATLESARM